MICQNCNSPRLIKRGYRQNRNEKRARYQCSDCGHYTTGDAEGKINVSARILLFDIETAPMEVYVWQLRGNDYISPDNIVKDYSVICWSAKWLFDGEVFGQSVTPAEVRERKDESILKKMWGLLDEADVVIVQNGKKFDIPKLNTRFALAGFPEPMYYQVIDTKEVMKKKFGFSSNKMDYVNKFLGIDAKTEMVWQDWLNCLDEDDSVSKAAIQKMLNYNKDDVVIMEELYLRLRPWIPAHANLGIYADTDKDCCPNCQSTELKWEGQYSTPLGLYEAFRCCSCGAIGRSTRAIHKIKSVEVRN